MTRVLIADDQARARRSLRALLTAMRWIRNGCGEQGEALIETVGEAGDGQGAIEQAELLHPDVVVMELHMPKLDGMTAMRIIKSRWPEIRVVVLTMYATERAVALESGASAFLLKGCSTTELLAALTSQDSLGQA